MTADMPLMRVSLMLMLTLIIATVTARPYANAAVTAADAS